MFYTDDPLDVEFLDGHLWLLLSDFRYLDAEVGLITVPAGFKTDFASIPKIFWNLLPATGRYGRAAVVHDWLYYKGRAGQTPVTRGQADAVFRRAMAEEGVGAFTRTLIWAAVRLGADGCWVRQRQERP